jgi:hypothetical protein
MPRKRTTLNVREYIRELCARTNAASQTNLISIGQVLREAGEISQTVPGAYAAAATSKDGATLLIATAIKPKLKNAAEDVMKYGDLVQDESKDVPGDVEDNDLFVPTVCSLRHKLAKELERCSPDGERRFSVFRITLSDVYPTAYLRLAKYKVDASGDTFIEFIEYSFGPREQQGQQPEDRRQTIELDGRLLNTAARLLAPNVAAANRARLPVDIHENGPPDDTDGPVPPDASDSQGANPGTDGDDETPRGATPEATHNTNLEASDRQKESQVGFTSQGDSSGGASAATPTEKSHDDDRRDRSGSAQPCAA